MVIKIKEEKLIDAYLHAEAEVFWENDQQVNNIYFKVPETFSHCVTKQADPFLLAAAIPAFFYGEKRILIENSDVTHSLFHNIKIALQLVKHHHKVKSTIPELLVTLKEDQKPGFGTASFLSGGVDSLYTLKKNHDYFPHSHPNRIVAGILAYGFDIGVHGGRENPELFNKAVDNLKILTSGVGIDLIPVITNVRQLQYGKCDWELHYHGAALASIASLLQLGYTTFLCGSTFDLKGIDDNHNGNDPLLMDYLSSYHARVVTDGIESSRFEKTAYISDYKVASNSLRVCYQNTDKLNCGVCEKCIRTKLALFCLSKLELFKVFENMDLDEALISKNVKISYVTRMAYVDMLPYLQEKNKRFASLLRDKIRQYDFKSGIKKMLKV